MTRDNLLMHLSLRPALKDSSDSYPTHENPAVELNNYILDSLAPQDHPSLVAVYVVGAVSYLMADISPIKMLSIFYSSLSHNSEKAVVTKPLVFY
jgi:hypothetical protein